ncbi:hypothetical protein [Psychroserpens damuponensis]|uniref:hypothetical protein n=1 Tax=Psychroserpens damuponensis TaxID=943936 RepID=UPI00058BB249|nr:hypothetical protein [Psychroserpens damuponensis]
MKKFLIITLSFFAFISLMYLGLNLFGKMIYNKQSCERFNIDNIELRTGVNIPEVTTTYCQCKDNKKVSKFIINTDKVDLDNYVSRNDFTQIDDLYIKENDTKNSTYKVVCNKKTAELIVNITYKTN